MFSYITCSRSTAVFSFQIATVVSNFIINNLFQVFKDTNHFTCNSFSSVNASFYICSQQKYCSQAKKLGNAPFSFCSTYSLYASAKMLLLHYSYHKLKSYHNLLFRLNHKSFPDKDSIYEVCILTCRSNKHHRNIVIKLWFKFSGNSF